MIVNVFFLFFLQSFAFIYLNSVLLYNRGDNMNEGKNIRENRKRMGLSQKELGERLGVSQQHIAQYENGKRIPKIETMRKIATALNISINDLMPDSSEYNIRVQAGTESSATDYGFIEAMARHEIFTDKERKKIFQKIEHCRTVLVNMKDSDKLLEYSEKTHNELEDTLLEMLLKKPNCDIGQVIIILSCFLSLNDNGRSSLESILLDHCYPATDLEYW